MNFPGNDPGRFAGDAEVERRTIRQSALRYGRWSTGFGSGGKCQGGLS